MPNRASQKRDCGGGRKHEMARRAALRGSHLVALALPQITVVPVIVPALATHVSHRDQLHRSSTQSRSPTML